MRHEEIQVQFVPIERIEKNIGQIEGLPANPRQWSLHEVETLAASIERTPRFLGRRPLIVYPSGDKYVILGGNMRFDALLFLGETEAPCLIYPTDASLDELKEVVIKDNGKFGNWDYDELANNWDDLDLSSMGVPVWDTDISTEGEAPTQSDPDDGAEKLTFAFTPAEAVFVCAELAKIDANKETALLHLLGYKDDNDE